MLSLCPKKDVCGSCSWSNIPYAKQLDQKLSDINGSFKLKDLDIRCEEIWSSPKQSHYRNRMDFAIDFEGRVGLREKGKWWRVIDGHTCFLADEKIEALYQPIRDWVKTSGLSFYDRKSHEGFLRYAVIRCSSIGQTMINIVTSTPTSADNLEAFAPLFDLPTTLIHSINNTQSDVSFGEEVRVLSGPGFIEEEIDGLKFRISPNAFLQTNSYASPLLLKTVKDFCGDLSQSTLLDLYCGTGFFAVALAQEAKKTIGVELNSEAIQDAKINAELNKVHVEFTAAPTESYDWAGHQADCVVLDPPRSGMHDRAFTDLLRILPKEIIYVSCNPKNFAREMVQLNKYYRIDAMRAIDMFPQTPHVELVTKLLVK